MGKSVIKNRIAIHFVLISTISSLAFADQLPDQSGSSIDRSQADGGRASGTARSRSTIEEVIVSAQRRDESAQEVSIAISVFSGDRLKELGAIDTRDIANIVPGFRYGNSSYNTPIYTLRGVGFDTQSQTAMATVGVYQDEVNLPYPVMSKGSNLDLERVEVLKGPQGTLFGRNTTGGAISYIANKPSEYFEAGLEASYSRFQARDIEGYISGPLPVLETLEGRLAVRMIKAGEGWQESLSRDDTLGEMDKSSARLILTWSPVESLTTSFTLSAWKDKSDFQAPQAFKFEIQAFGESCETATGDPNDCLSPQVREQPLAARNEDDAAPEDADWSPDLDFITDEKFYSPALRIEWMVFEQTNLTFLTAYQKWEADGSITPRSGLGVTDGEERLDAKTTAYSAELRLDGYWGSNIDWIVGLFYSKDDVFDKRTLIAGELSSSRAQPLPRPVPNLLGDGTIFKGEQTGDSKAVFFNTGWTFSEAMKLTLGARYTEEERKFTGCSKDPDDAGAFRVAPILSAVSIAQGGSGEIPENGCFALDPETRDPGEYNGNLKEDNISLRIALDWNPVEDFLVYASFDRGYKSGSFPVLGASDQQQYEPVTQEKLKAYELGLKSNLWSRRVQLNASAFYYDYQDKQLQSRFLDDVFGQVANVVNVPESRVYGFEVDSQMNPIPGLLLGLSGIYLDTKIYDFVGLDVRGEETDFSGNPFNYSPRTEYTALVNYERDILNDYIASIGVDYSYTDDTTSSIAGEPEFDHGSYFLLNARIGVSDIGDTWSVGLFGRNLTNELGTQSIIKARDTFARYVEKRRTYGVKVSYKF